MKWVLLNPQAGELTKLREAPRTEVPYPTYVSG